MAVEPEPQRSIGQDSTDPDDYQDLAESLLESGRWQEAIAVLDRALRLPLKPCDRAGTMTWQALVLAEVGEDERARTLAEDALSLIRNEEESAELLLCRGQAYSVLAHYRARRDPNSGREEATQAVHSLKQAIAKSETGGGPPLTALYEIGHSQMLLGQFDEAVQSCQRCIELEISETGRLNCLMLLGSIFRRAGRLSEAEEVFRELREHVSPATSPLFHLELGGLLLDLNRPVEACETLERALHALEVHQDLRHDRLYALQIYLHLAPAAFACDDFRKASAAYEKALGLMAKEDEHRPHCSLTLGICRVQIGQLWEAKERLVEVLESSQASDSEKTEAKRWLRDVHLGLSRYHVERGEYEAAVREYESGPKSALEPDDTWRADLLQSLGNTFFSHGFHESARSCFQEILSWGNASEGQRRDALQGLDRLPPRRVQ